MISFFKMEYPLFDDLEHSGVFGSFRILYDKLEVLPWAKFVPARSGPRGVVSAKLSPRSDPREVIPAEWSPRSDLGGVIPAEWSPRSDLGGVIPAQTMVEQICTTCPHLCCPIGFIPLCTFHEPAC